MNERVDYVCRDGVATITMDDGKVNVMSTDMIGDIDRALDRAEKDQAVVVLKSGRRDVFSAGFDLKLFAANDREGSLAMVKAGAELALRLMTYSHPTIGVMEGHAFPMGTFLLLACDVRLATDGAHKMGLNEVAIGISPPGFAIELARSRMSPAWHSRTVTLGEMYEPKDAVAAGLLDKVVPKSALAETLAQTVSAVKAVNQASHAVAKKRLRQPTMDAMQAAINRELTMDAYASGERTSSAVVRPRH